MEIDRDMLAIALSKAISDAVPEEMRNEIFRRALENHLFAARRGGETPFTRALNQQACSLVAEMMGSPEFREKIKASIAEAFEKSWPSLANKFTEKIQSALRW